MINLLRYIFILIFLVSLCSEIKAQRILFQSDFENIQLVFPDSLPSHWKKQDVDGNIFGVNKSWAVRDTTQYFGSDTAVFKVKSHSGKKALQISWYSGKGGNYIADDWVWTDSLRIKTNDSLIFWSLLGSIPGIALYVDSLQVWVCSSQSPSGASTKLNTLISNRDSSYNFWQQNKFVLSQFNGQKIYIGFRYYLNVTDALWCNIDDIFIGNRGPLSIDPISSVVPSRFDLGQNYPNPFNPETNIRFSIHDNSRVYLSVSDIKGNEIKKEDYGYLSPGEYKIKFNAADLPSGTYFYTIQAGTNSLTKKMILLK